MGKIKELDYLRGLSTIFVIIIHLTSSFLNYSSNSYTYQIIGSLNCSLTFVVPAFLFISAFIMTYQVKDKENLNWIKFISKKIIKVLSALILWTIIYIIYWGAIKNITLTNIRSYLTLGSASYHLYFLPLIIQLYLLFPAIWFITKNLSKIKLNTYLSFILCIIAAAIFQYAFTTIFRLNIFKTFQYFSTIIFSYTLPITISVWIGFNYDKIKKFYNTIFLLCAILLSAISCYYYVKFEFINYTYKTTLLFSPFYWTIIIITLIYLLRYVKENKFLTEISNKSFIIYLSHPLILDIINNKLNFKIPEITSKSLINYSIDISIKFILILTISYFISSLWYKLKK